VSQSDGADRLAKIEAELATIIENEKTLYDDLTKLKEATKKIAEVVDQHSNILRQIMGGGAPQANTPPTQVAQAPPPAPQGQGFDLAQAMQFIAPIIQTLRGGGSDPVTQQLVSAALQSAVETLRAGPMLVQAVASSLGGSFGKTYGREAGHQLAKNLGKVVEATGQVVEEAPPVEGGEVVLEK